MKLRIFALTLIFSLLAWAQATPPATDAAPKAGEKACCCQHDSKDGAGCCNHAKADGKEAMACCGKDKCEMQDGKSCCAGKDAKAGMHCERHGSKDAKSCCEGKSDKTAGKCCGGNKCERPQQAGAAS